MYTVWFKFEDKMQCIEAESLIVARLIWDALASASHIMRSARP